MNNNEANKKKRKQVVNVNIPCIDTKGKASKCDDVGRFGGGCIGCTFNPDNEF